MTKAPKTVVEAMTSTKVLQRLEQHWKPGAHAWLYEVRNSTGYSRVARTADALVCSCWPSHGLWLAGIEVKVSRSDWLHELKQPEKAWEVQKFCDYWWLAAPEGVARVDEMPERWGLIELRGRNVCVVKRAPKLEPDPLSMGFVASVLRNQAEKRRTAEQRSEARGREAAAQDLGAEQMEKLRLELAESRNEANRLRQAKEDLERIRERVKRFEREAGLPEHTLLGDISGASWSGPPVVGRMFALAQLLASKDVELVRARIAGALTEIDRVTSLGNAAGG